MKLILLTFYLAQYVQNSIISTVNIKKIFLMRHFASLKPCENFTVTANSDIKFLSNILNLYLDFIKFIVEKIDSHPQIVPKILKKFPND